MVIETTARLSPQWFRWPGDHRTVALVTQTFTEFPQPDQLSVWLSWATVGHSWDPVWNPPKFWADSSNTVWPWP